MARRRLSGLLEDQRLLEAGEPEKPAAPVKAVEDALTSLQAAADAWKADPSHPRLIDNLIHQLEPRHGSVSGRLRDFEQALRDHPGKLAAFKVDQTREMGMAGASASLAGAKSVASSTAKGMLSKPRGNVRAALKTGDLYEKSAKTKWVAFGKALKAAVPGVTFVSEPPNEGDEKKGYVLYHVPSQTFVVVSTFKSREPEIHYSAGAEPLVKALQDFVK